MKYIKFSYKWVTLLVLPFIFGCNKDPKTADLTFNIAYQVDGEEVVLNDIRYTNAAGNEYSISRLSYYLSGFSLEGGDGYTSDEVFYQDIEDSPAGTLTLKDVPEGEYSSITFYYGIGPTQNVTDGLPASSENVEMAWPDMMGGGYHFMKLEGQYLETSGATIGYATHLGRNDYVVTIHLLDHLHVMHDHDNVINLSYNLNEWYKNPNSFDFNTDGISIMSNLPSLQKLSENGVDIFTIVE